MSENKNGVRLGKGVADDMKHTANQELSDIGKMLIGIIARLAKGRYTAVGDYPAASESKIGLCQRGLPGVDSWA